MHNTLAVHEVDSSHQLVHNVHGLHFCEELLALDARQQLAPLKQFHHHIRVQLKHTSCVSVRSGKTVSVQLKQHTSLS